MTQEANMGKVIQVIGPVVDVEFPSEISLKYML